MTAWEKTGEIDEWLCSRLEWKVDGGFWVVDAWLNRAWLTRRRADVVVFKWPGGSWGEYVSGRRKSDRGGIYLIVSAKTIH